MCCSKNIVLFCNAILEVLLLPKLHWKNGAHLEIAHTCAVCVPTELETWERCEEKTLYCMYSSFSAKRTRCNNEDAQLEIIALKDDFNAKLEGYIIRVPTVLQHKTWTRGS